MVEQNPQNVFSFSNAIKTTKRSNGMSGNALKFFSSHVCIGSLALLALYHSNRSQLEALERYAGFVASVDHRRDVFVGLWGFLHNKLG